MAGVGKQLNSCQTATSNPTKKRKPSTPKVSKSASVV
jgi:hypothetical protein